MDRLLIICILIITAINAVFLFVINKKMDEAIERQRLLIDMKGGEEDMAYVYAFLIMKGLRTFNTIPKMMTEAVKQALIYFEAEHLIPGNEKNELEVKEEEPVL